MSDSIGRAQGEPGGPVEAPGTSNTTSIERKRSSRGVGADDRDPSARAHPDTARNRIGLGAALGGQGRRLEADALIEAGLVARQTVLSGAHPNVAAIYDTLAADAERAGDFIGALEYTERSLEIMTAAYGEGGFSLLSPHGNMCAVLGHLGRVEQAVTHCRRALEIGESGISVDPRLMAGLHNNLGSEEPCVPDDTG